MQYSPSTKEAADRFRTASNDLAALPVKTTPIAQLEAAVRVYDDAAQALAHLVLSDIDAAAREVAQ